MEKIRGTLYLSSCCMLYLKKLDLVLLQLFALLHDVVEDTNYEIEDIKRIFGPKVSKIIEGLTKISDVFDQDISLQAKILEK